MKKLKLLFLFLILSILFVQCENISKTQELESLSSFGKNIKIGADLPIMDPEAIEPEIINVPEDVFENPLDLSSLIRDFDFTLLETSEECLIGAVNKILSDKGSYFIHLKENNAVFRFSYEGKFINSIGSLGKGPQEFNEAWDVALDKDNEMISILDLKGRKIIRYTYDGKFSEIIPMYFLYSKHVYAEGYMALLTGKSYNATAPTLDSYALVLASEDQTPISRAFHYPPVASKNSWTTNNPLRKFQSSLYYHQPFSNQIWQIEDEKFTQSVKINYKENGISDNTWKTNIRNSEMEKIMNTKVHFTGNFVVNENFYFFGISEKNRSAGVLQDRSSKHVMSWTKNIPSQPEGKFWLYSFLFKSPLWLREDGVFLNVQNPHAIVQFKDHLLEKGQTSSKESALTKNEREKIEKMEITDNPIIVHYNFKNF